MPSTRQSDDLQVDNPLVSEALLLATEDDFDSHVGITTSPIP